ncbi:helix-turn-helix domain-containing protein [Intestinibacter sp.]
MSKVYNFEDNILLLSNYKQPQQHNHLAYHIMISLGDNIECTIENQTVKGRGICIKSNVNHTGNVDKNGMLIFLFTETSKYIESIKEVYLQNKNYCIIDDDIVDSVITMYHEHENNTKTLNADLLKVCKLKPCDKKRYDERIEKVFDYISNLETIEHDIVDELVAEVHLSKTRLSHLFKKNTGIALHSYIAYEKLRKTYWYKVGGKSLTEACILAGFNSSSHCSSTCKKMFGFSFREIYKNLQTIDSK